MVVYSCSHIKQSLKHQAAQNPRWLCDQEIYISCTNCVKIPKGLPCDTGAVKNGGTGTAMIQEDASVKQKHFMETNNHFPASGNTKQNNHFPASGNTKRNNHFPANGNTKWQNHFSANGNTKWQNRFPANGNTKWKNHFPANGVTKNLSASAKQAKQKRLIEMKDKMKRLH
uniref:Uncharacterized protein n=1 Tax=Anopheles funestus TaxID=62324 RepID=A0A4Y0BII1_ANOFN